MIPMEVKLLDLVKMAPFVVPFYQQTYSWSRGPLCPHLIERAKRGVS